MIPVQKWWQAPYFWAGTKFYDFLAGSEGIESSYFLTKSRALDAFPMLKKTTCSVHWYTMVYSTFEVRAKRLADVRQMVLTMIRV